MNSSNLFILLAIALPFKLFSQIRLIVVSDDGDAVSYAHIFLDNKAYTYSDEYGEFKIDSRQTFDTLKISHLSYETKLILYKDVVDKLMITLKEKNNILEEVAVTSTGKKRKKQVLIPEKAARGPYDIRLISDFGVNTFGVDESSDEINLSKAVYVPNVKGYENAVITKIILHSVDKEIKGDTKYIPFRVNLMTYDTIAKLPKEKIFEEDLLVGKKRGQTIEIDLSEIELVDFPKEGICVMVSVYHTEYYNNNGFYPPAFDVANNNLDGFREYVKGLVAGDQWEEQGISKDRLQVFNWGIEIKWQE